jgi:hypothetical protein
VQNGCGARDAALLHQAVEHEEEIQIEAVDISYANHGDLYYCFD